MPPGRSDVGPVRDMDMMTGTVVNMSHFRGCSSIETSIL